ncbi:MAG: cation diffusion facilitator family transporter [Deltaproteobacteria bacterium]
MPDAHHHIHATGTDSQLKRRLFVSIVFTGVVFVVELIGGYLTNSLALGSDAAHVFMDALALSLSLFAILISERPPDERRTYGLHRVEVFVAWINGFALIAVSLFIFYKAYFRFFHPVPVESTGMMLVALLGLVANLLVVMWLRPFAGEDLNVKSAFLHVVGDAVASVGVIVAALIIRLTGWYPADPLISAFIGAIVLVGAGKLMIESSHILLEGAPKDVDMAKVVSDIRSTTGVAGVHSLHVWSICHNVYALSAHLDVEPLERHRMGEIVGQVNERLAETHHIFYTTLQAECSGCDQELMFRRMSHKERGHLH